MPSVSHQPTWPALSWPGLKEGVVVLPVLGVARHDPPLRGILGLRLEVVHRLQHCRLVTILAGQEGSGQRVRVCVMPRYRDAVCCCECEAVRWIEWAFCGALSKAPAPRPGKETHQPLEMEDRNGSEGIPNTHQSVRNHGCRNIAGGEDLCERWTQSAGLLLSVFNYFPRHAA
jgi:hypothetical protein